MSMRHRLILGTCAVSAALLFIVAWNGVRGESGLPPRRIAVESKIVLGDNSPATSYVVVAFYDYQCPASLRLDTDIRDVLRQFPNQISWSVRHYPLPQHKFAASAAIAAEVARYFGKFSAVHEKLVALNGHLNESKITDVLQKAGIKHQLLAQHSARAKARLRADLSAVAKLGVTYTPAMFLCCPDGTVLQMFDMKQVEAAISLSANR